MYTEYYFEKYFGFSLKFFLLHIWALFLEEGLVTGSLDWRAMGLGDSNSSSHQVQAKHPLSYFLFFRMKMGDKGLHVLFIGVSNTTPTREKAPSSCQFIRMPARLRLGMFLSMVSLGSLDTDETQLYAGTFGNKEAQRNIPRGLKLQEDIWLVPIWTLVHFPPRRN